MYYRKHIRLDSRHKNNGNDIFLVLKLSPHIDWKTNRVIIDSSVEDSGGGYRGESGD